MTVYNDQKPPSYSFGCLSEKLQFILLCIVNFVLIFVLVFVLWKAEII